MDMEFRQQECEVSSHLGSSCSNGLRGIERSGPDKCTIKMWIRLPFNGDCHSVSSQTLPWLRKARSDFSHRTLYWP